MGSPTWSRSLAAAIWSAVARPALSGLHHWVDAGVASWYDFAVAIQEEALPLGLLERAVSIDPIQTQDYPTQARRPPYSVLDVHETRVALALPPVHWRLWPRLWLWRSVSRSHTLPWPWSRKSARPVLPWKAQEGTRRVSPLEASTYYLKHLAEAWNHQHARNAPENRLEEQEIILTVPASFDAVARELTVEAAHAAGLEHVTLIEEPQAAFYSWIETGGDGWREWGPS